MPHRFLLTLPLLLVVSGVASAQRWAEKMFNKLSHDFGTVARGSDIEYRFEVTNRYKEAMRITSVRSSCGCAVPSIENDTLQSWQTGYIVAKFNTRTFRGHHSATVTVNLQGVDKPLRAEVRLRVKGNIRGDVQFRPGSANFATVDQGTVHERTVSVTYVGKPNWEISDVRSESEHYEVEMTETARGGGLISYDLLIRLRENAPAGYFHDQLILVTNDSRNQRIPLDVEGTVIPEISVIPPRLVLGEIQPGTKVSKILVVRGKKPFKIQEIKCKDGCFSFKRMSDEASMVHKIQMTFTANEPGKVQEAILISTDRGENIGAVLTAYATVVAVEKPDSPETDGGDDAKKVDPDANKVADPDGS